ncbi:HD domain-containing protein, partial [bacterium CPR1]|nr:HD domain-containing protein [bacterium CPR1]
ETSRTDPQRVSAVETARTLESAAPGAPGGNEGSLRPQGPGRSPSEGSAPASNRPTGPSGAGPRMTSLPLATPAGPASEAYRPASEVPPAMTSPGGHIVLPGGPPAVAAAQRRLTTPPIAPPTPLAPEPEAGRASTPPAAGEPEAPATLSSPPARPNLAGPLTPQVAQAVSQPSAAAAVERDLASERAEVPAEAGTSVIQLGLRPAPQRVTTQASSTSSDVREAVAAEEVTLDSQQDGILPISPIDRRREPTQDLRQETLAPWRAAERNERQAFGAEDARFDSHSEPTTGAANRLAPTLAGTVRQASAQGAQANQQSQQQESGFGSGDQGQGGDDRGADRHSAHGLGRGPAQAQNSTSTALAAIMAAMQPEGAEEAEAQETHRAATMGASEMDSVQLESVANRHAASAVTSLLKKANKEKELGDLQNLDEDAALHSLGVMLKMGGQSTERSEKVMQHAMAMADELGINDFRTRKQIRDGAMLIDIGQVGIALGGASDEKIDLMADFLNEHGTLNLRALHASTILRDVGKIQVPEEILAKAPDELTSAEMEELKKHPIYGEEIMNQIGSLKHLGPIIRSHHERWDGNGYPDGLAGRDIPLASRIIAVADHFEDLLAAGPDGKPFSVENALQTLRDGSGAQFDPVLIDAFLRVMERI